MLAVCLLQSALAQELTLTFGRPDQPQDMLLSYHDQGFGIVCLLQGSTNINGYFFVRGSLFPEFGGGEVLVLSQDNGNPFSLLSVNWFNFFPGDTTGIEGVREDGSSVFHSIPLAAGTQMVTNAFGAISSSYMDLTSYGFTGVTSLILDEYFGKPDSTILAINSITVTTNLAPTLQSSLLTQTVELGTSVDLSVRATGLSPFFYLWYFNNTNFIGSSTNYHLLLTNLQFSQSGGYTVVVTNAYGAVTSSPAMLNVISAVLRRSVPAISVIGETGSSVSVGYHDNFGSPSSWLALDLVNLTNPPQYWFDLSTPLPAQRFYRVWQTGTPAVIPSFKLISMVPAVTVTGNVGNSVRLDYINAIGPTNAWVTLDTVTLTNTSQLYFDVTAPSQPKRFYRLVQIP